MAILYTQIKRKSDNSILTGEFSQYSSSLKNTNDLLKELRDMTSDLSGLQEGVTKYNSSDSRISILLYCLSDLVYSVVIDDSTSEKNALKYIDTVEKEFKKIYKPNTKSTYYNFDSVIKKLSTEFETTKYQESMQVVDETKGILADSLNLIIQRRENIDNLSKLANRMSIEAQYMQKNVKKMRFRSIINDYGVYAIIIFIFFLFMYYITR